MKLKRRVIITCSLCVGMTLLFVIGTQLVFRNDDQEEAPASDRQQLNPGALKGPPVESNRDKLDVRINRGNLLHLVQREGDLGKNTQRLNRTKLQGPPPPPMPIEFGDRLRRENLPEGPPKDSNEQFPHFPFNIDDDVLRKLSPNFVNRLTNRNQNVNDVNRNQLSPEATQKDPWKIWEGWVKPEYLYPEDAFWSDEMNYILDTMASARITSFGVGHKGTQLKASLFLGKQRTAFKPMRYPRDEVIEGDPYAGCDRHNGEIAGFHLDGILGFRISPPVVGRRINLTELRPVTSEKLLATYFVKDGNTCFYGVCYYCRREEAACAEGDVMEGAVTLWLPNWYELKTWRHPWQRTYRHGAKAKWETDDDYCQHLMQPSSEYYHGILEFTDTAVFDFLMGNADRHHYETYAKANQHGRLMHFDNGKSFGNPHHDELSILAPLTQCCRLRESTWQRLLSLQPSEQGPLSKVLEESLKRDPVYPVLTGKHLAAIDRRHSIVIQAVNHCIDQHGKDTVIT